MSKDDRRPLPHNLEAEQSLLGAILLRPILMVDLAPSLDPGDFMDPKHGTIYAAMLAMFDTGEVIDVVTVHERLAGQIDQGYLLGLQNATPSISHAHRYAAIAIETSRLRRMIGFFAERAEECFLEKEADEILAKADAGADRLIASRAVNVEGLHLISDFMALRKANEHFRPWLIPHVMKMMWRVILVAGEGAGKMVLMRFLALHAAAGRDPWQPNRFIDPVKCLVIDCENSPDSIGHQFEISNTRDNLIDEAADNLHVWHREQGMNLRDRRPQAELEAVLQKVKPQIVFAGPLRKLFKRSTREDMEQVALEVQDVWDQLRKRYGIAVMFEHHAPKGQLGHRDLVPFGSGAWMGWPEFGLTMEPIGNPSFDAENYELELGRFRRDREPADWPWKLERGAPMSVTAWTPTWREARGKRLKLAYANNDWHDERQM